MAFSSPLRLWGSLSEANVTAPADVKEVASSAAIWGRSAKAAGRSSNPGGSAELRQKRPSSANLCPAVLTGVGCSSSLLGVAASSQVQKNLQAAMREALRMQDRFVAEPLFAKTGRGYLKSEGVSTLSKIKANLRRKPAAKSK